MNENKRYCKDCKHCRGIGYDFWCGEGHTEYEVFLGETNCPYYEFHDWSKGAPDRTKNKRFYYNTYYHKDDPSRVLEYEIIDRQSYPNYPDYDEEDIPDWYIYITENDSGWQDMLINKLNQLNDENEQLEQNNKDLIHLLEEQSMVVRELRLKLMDHQLKKPIVFTKEDLEIMGKAISYYTHRGG